MSNNTKLLCLFLRAQKINKSSEQGYAMAMVSMVSIIMLSLLAASMTFSNLAKSRTDAFVDSHSAFSVAEAGLNKRAVEFRAKIETYSGVKDVSALTGSQTISNCFEEGASSSTPGTDYLGCRNYSFKSRNNASTVVAANGDIALNNFNENEAVNEYIAYTAITKNPPQLISVSDGDYAGLNALEYKYVLHSTAKRPVKSEATLAGNADKSSNNIDLSMTFTNRVISLFQFAVFYNGDLEFNSTTPMSVKGWVHSNANIYVQPAGEGTSLSPSSNSITTFLAKVSAVGNIYNRVDAWTPGIGRTGITRVLLTGADCSTATNCKDISAYGTGSDPTAPLGATEINTFKKKLVAETNTPLKAPSRGFPRKRSYVTPNAGETPKVGEYYAKADMRLDFVPDRDVTDKTKTPWTRDTKIIPFNFTAVTTTGAGTCSSTAPSAGIDPAANYIAPEREGLSTLKCNKLTKGQLQSLRQPVMVLTTLKQTTALATQESTTLGVPDFTTLPYRAPILDLLNDNPINKNKILRALQVVIASTPTPISVDQLSNTIATSPDPFKTEFFRLFDVIFPLPTGTSPSDQALRDAINADRVKLLGSTPNQIAALRSAWFLPAPIQRVETGTVQDAASTRTATTTTTPNPSSSGFYDGREQRWISVLQTNMASLSVWNRDGLYVEASDNTTDLLRRAVYATTTALKDTAFNSGTGANFTDGLAFDRATTIPSTITAKGLQPLGLGSIDSTEGGLIFHASVNDDLNGDGSIDTTNDITKDTTKPITETTTNPISGVATTTTIDYYRTYPGITGSPKSPFAFAFTGGDYLPNNLMLTSDQAIYVQGNFNNNSNTIAPSGASASSDDRLSASIVADTITVLSNDCISLTPSTTNTGVPTGQLNCGIKGGANLVTRSMVINAAFLSNTDISVGNLGTGRGYDATYANNKYSGGVNNYIRLLEDWNNGGTGSPFALNYMGSMISLGAPLEYSGQYRPGGDVASATGVTPVVIASYYNVPFRNFSYDPNFNSVDKMPPLTPKASYVQQKNFSRTY